MNAAARSSNRGAFKSRLGKKSASSKEEADPLLKQRANISASSRLFPPLTGKALAEIFVSAPIKSHSRCFIAQDDVSRIRIASKIR